MSVPSITDRALAVPMWAIAAPLLIAPAANALNVLRRRRKLRRGLCVQCGYDLRASNLRCPECGHSINVTPRAGMIARCSPSISAAMTLVIVAASSVSFERYFVRHSQAHWAPYEATSKFVAALEAGPVDIAAARAALGEGADMHGHPFRTATETMELILAAEDPALLRLLNENGFRLSGGAESYPLLRDALWHRRDPDLLAQLLRCGANPNAPSPHSDQTVLMSAVTEGKFYAVRLLLDAGADINAANSSGQTVLHLLPTTSAYPPAMLGLLLSFHPRLDMRDGDGNTPLHVAAKERSLVCVRLLLDAGADLNIRNAAGQTAQQLIDTATWPQGAALLRERARSK